MVTLYLIFLLSCVNILIKRSENCDISRPKQEFKTKSKIFLHYILEPLFYIYWIQWQIISTLLQISGIERNPGPNPSRDKQSQTCKENNCGICAISHTCKVKGCDAEIFASCHCNSCEGFGPLLCYNHFVNDSCKRIRTKSNLDLSQKPNHTQCIPIKNTALSSTPIPSNNSRNIKSTNINSTKTNSVECSTCYKSIPISTVGLTPTCWHSINRAKGYFHYTCKNCLTKSTRNSLDLSSNAESFLNKAAVTKDENLSYIIIRKRRKLIKQNCALYISKLPLNASGEHHTSNATFKLKNIQQSKESYTPIPLSSLCLKPPPIYILRKWWKILNVPKDIIVKPSNGKKLMKPQGNNFDTQIPTQMLHFNLQIANAIPTNPNVIQNFPSKIAAAQTVGKQRSSVNKVPIQIVPRNKITKLIKTGNS